jgi:hypothetical protein
VSPLPGKPLHPQWLVAGTLAIFELNWLRPHRALRAAWPEPPGRSRYQQRAPAITLRLTDHSWS